MDSEVKFTRKSLDEKIGKIALPLPILPPEYAGDLLSMLREADDSEMLKTDVDAITMDVCNGKADLVVMALDAQDSDSLAHLPILSLTRKVAYFFVPHITSSASGKSASSSSVCCVIKGSHALETSIRRLCGATVLEETLGNSYFESMLQVPVQMGLNANWTIARVVKDAFDLGILKIGMDEVTKALCGGSKIEFIVMAADAHDVERMFHLPILAKSKEAFCIFVPSTTWIAFNVDEFTTCSQPVTACCVTSHFRALTYLNETVLRCLAFQSEQCKLVPGFEPPLKTFTFRTSPVINQLMECKTINQ